MLQLLIFFLFLFFVELKSLVFVFFKTVAVADGWDTILFFILNKLITFFRGNKFRIKAFLGFGFSFFFFTFVQRYTKG